MKICIGSVPAAPGRSRGAPGSLPGAGVPPPGIFDDSITLWASPPWGAPGSLPGRSRVGGVGQGRGNPAKCLKSEFLFFQSADFNKRISSLFLVGFGRKKKPSYKF